MSIDPLKAPYRPNPRKTPEVTVERRADGSTVITAPALTGAYPASICDYLYRQAEAYPDRTFMAERGADGAWQHMTYATMLGRARAVGQWMIDHGFDQSTPLMILSANSVNQAIVTFGAMLVGVPVAPVSPPYALMSKDFAKLKQCAAAITPALIYVEVVAPFAAAISALGMPDVPVISTDANSPTSLKRVLETEPTDEVEARHKAVTPDMVAKVLFTSGSTGSPKAVINTHRNLVCVPAMRSEILETYPLEEPEIILDWLPWHHTFGGNAVVNLVLFQGNTLYLDNGRPLPGMFEETIRNIIELKPSQFTSVPAAFGMLAQHLEQNAELRAALFERVKLFGYGGAALGQDVYERIQKLAVETCGQRIHFSTGCGSTETGALSTLYYWTMETMGHIGLPPPGTRIKLVPTGDRMALWIKGDQVMPGYLNNDAENAKVFDDERYFDTGDAVTWVDADNPQAGVIFAGRVAENFKLANGTWVVAGAVRLSLLDALGPLAQEAVIAGQDRDYVAALVWPNPAGCLAASGCAPDTPMSEVMQSQPLIDAFKHRLALHNKAAKGRAAQVKRIGFLSEPPSLDRNEITDKRYVNQSAVLQNRADAAAALFQDPPHDRIIA